MRADLCSISPPRLDRDKVQSSPSGEASFAKALERLEQMEERISLEIDRLADLKAQIESVIRQLKHPGYQLVMICRYLEGRTWREIGDRMNRGETTVRTWHRNAIAELTLPENPIYL